MVNIVTNMGCAVRRAFAQLTISVGVKRFMLAFVLQITSKFGDYFFAVLF